MIGLGVTPEGINQNYIVYDLMSEMAYRPESLDLDPFVDHYIYRRYGDFDNNVSDAWQILKVTSSRQLGKILRIRYFLENSLQFYWLTKHQRKIRNLTKS